MSHESVCEVASAESCEELAVQPGRWYDVPGLTQISYTDIGEKAPVTIISMKIMLFL